MTTYEVSTGDSLWRMTNGYQVSQAIHVVATLGDRRPLEGRAQEHG